MGKVKWSKFKKPLIVGSLGVVSMFMLSGCALTENIHHDYTNNNYTSTFKPQTLHSSSQIKTFSVDYYDTHSNEDGNNAMDQKVNGYLHSIKNLHDYKWSVKPDSVGDDGSNQEDQVQVDTVVLHKKPSANE